ncbi:hypothetical protein AJ79_01938 [Helicocarpus griseus UAMH5409]|uniref:protein-ribulosamine 3-kinase n=1 Tax=Helicocarpus griseus UAMH5409 TaxID=1447875 RepID=A0A2B7Y594_9EURO|nr:hypothetical protein AJ79_01938 [Helicocarpus griseus UAMH5409]
MQEHGEPSSSKPYKITATVDAKKKYYFAKISTDGQMFEGKHASLTALYNAVPSICPRSVGHGKLINSDAHYLITEFIDVDAYGGHRMGCLLQQKLVMLHTAPVPIPEGSNGPMFGFPVTTYVGGIKQDNTFCSSWAEFYAEKRLHAILRSLEEKHGIDEELRDWVTKTTSVVVPRLLREGHLGGQDGIKLSLVHGDLWGGNKFMGVLDAKRPTEDFYI